MHIDYMTTTEHKACAKAMSLVTVLSCERIGLSVDLDASLRFGMTYILRLRYDHSSNGKQVASVCVRSYDPDFELVHGMIFDRAVMALKDYVCMKSLNIQAERKLQGCKAFDLT